MNQHIIFDRTRYTDKLRDNGVDEKTARAHSDALDGALRDAVATKTDLQEVEQSLRNDIGEVEQSIRAAEHSLQSDIRKVEQSLTAGIQKSRDEMHELEGRVNKHFVEIDGKFADINVRFAEMHTKFAEQNAKSETIKSDILRWLVGTQIALAGLLIGVMLKFMK
jgi:chromosome segregation ATPase